MRQVRCFLLQCRQADDPMLQHEVACFAEALALYSPVITPVNIVTDRILLEQSRDHDVVLVGGAGDYSVLDDYEFLRPFFDTLGELCDRGFPVFASCFGFQAICHALGGSVVYDSDSMEVGTFDLGLTEAGRKDPLFGLLPQRFSAQLGHKDKAESLPTEAVALAWSERCALQAFRLSDKPIYATQFHPELTVEQNRMRFNRYLKNYSNHLTREEIDETQASFAPSEAASRLLQGYARLFLS